MQLVLSIFLRFYSDSPADKLEKSSIQTNFQRCRLSWLPNQYSRSPADSLSDRDTCEIESEYNLRIDLIENVQMHIIYIVIIACLLSIYIYTCDRETQTRHIILVAFSATSPCLFKSLEIDHFVYCYYIHQDYLGEMI